MLSLRYLRRISPICWELVLAIKYLLSIVQFIAPVIFDRHSASVPAQTAALFARLHLKEYLGRVSHIYRFDGRCEERGA